ncbi:hypothetical protein MMC10_011362 [Thelotrema lepadinum]|nr:hypothetical protein [Thelotrema lepadinum]
MNEKATTSPSISSQVLPPPSSQKEVATSSPDTGKVGRIGRIWKAVYKLGYTPKRCRWDPEHPPEFGMGLNLVFSFGATFSVANLYYNHPILNILAEDFNVSFERVSIVPTLMQAGYAVGLLFLCPLGDILRRRAFILTLTWITATMWLALCITTSFETFAALSFVASITTVTPQLLLPLVGDMAPPHKRAHALSIVVSGLLAGMLIARLLSGIVTEYTTWRNVYWISFGMQYIIVILLYLFLPDAPPNPTNTHLTYTQTLSSIFHLVTHSPVLLQACLIGFLTSATFTNFWTTLTFLLSSPPFSLSPLQISLFALIGLITLIFGPPLSKFLLTTLRLPPIHTILLAETITLAGVIAGTYTGTFSLAGPIVQALTIDLGLQTQQVANRASIYAAEPDAKSRTNTAYMVCVFAGQIAGTAVGNGLFAFGGWVRSGSASVGFIGGAILVCLVRGPWAEGWVGWKGEWGRKRKEQWSGDEENGKGEEGNEEGGEKSTAKCSG